MKTVEECIAWVRECIGATPYDDIMVESTTAHLRRLSALEAENKKTLSLLRELYATVMGECSGILDEDRGGNSRLALDIESALSGEG